MNKIIVAFVVGLLFGLGLVISGMTDPGKVYGFLDIFGDFDPALMAVMVGGIGVHSLLYRFITKRNTPLLDSKFLIPQRKDIDKRLLIGSAIFGIGWGMGGICPGPGITAIASGQMLPVIFVVSMLAGMGLFRLVGHRIFH